MTTDILFRDSVDLLKKLIETPSLSRDEEQAALVLRQYLANFEIPYQTLYNNTWCQNKYWDESKPVILLNSHIDTVKPVKEWSYDPFTATLEGDKLIGLGCNDAGASVVALLAVFRYFYEQKDLPFNLIYGITAEEESSGPKGMAELVKVLGNVDFAIVGEPTQMKLAVAEKGLVVLDATVKGKAGHAARNEGVNSIYLAIDEINKIRNFKFPLVSDLLGEVKQTITIIEAGYQHNVVPDTCKFVVDVRTNECYSNEKVVEIIKGLVNCEIEPRSLRLNSSGIEIGHPFVQKAKQLGIECYGSPTISDQTLMNYKSVKMGPGDSARSHTANEFIYLHEICEGIDRYIELLANLNIRN